MRYHRSDVAFVETVQFCRASPAIQAALHWLWVACAKAENDGTIHNSKTYSDADWKAITCGQITRRRVQQVVDAKLAHWEGDHLMVAGYDVTGQQAYQAQRTRMTELRRERGESSSGNRASTRQALCAHGADRREEEGREEERMGSPPPPGPAGAAGAPDATGAGGGAPLKKIPRADWAAVRAGIASGNPLAVIAAFHADMEDSSGWLRESGGITVGTLAVILAWRTSQNAAVRLPSGLRLARAEWRQLSDDARKAQGQQYSDLLGLRPTLETPK